MSVPFAPQLTELAAIKATLLKQPSDLHGARLAAAEAERDVKAAKKRLADVEAERADRLAEITALVAGDEAFKNETARKAEARRRGKVDADLVRLDTLVRTHEDELLKAEMRYTQATLDVRRREDEQRAWRGLLDATQAETMLLVAGR